jgi:hypothetical protein
MDVTGIDLFEFAEAGVRLIPAIVKPLTTGLGNPRGRCCCQHDPGDASQRNTTDSTHDLLPKNII